jgi:hypothetical protein
VTSVALDRWADALTPVLWLMIGGDRDILEMR